MPPKNNGNVKKSEGGEKGSGRGKSGKSKSAKKKRNPWDSGSSDENNDDDELPPELAHYFDFDDLDDEENDGNFLAPNSDDDQFSDEPESLAPPDGGQKATPSAKKSTLNKSKMTVLDGLDEEIDDDDEEDEESPNDAGSETASQECMRFVTGSAKDKRCVWLEDRDLPHLDLPMSSDDLIITKNLTLKALEIYECCRRFGHIIRLSPFLFEDFCCCLSSRDQSPLLDEIHIQFLRLLLKGDESCQTIFGPNDCRDSINVSFYLLNTLTYGEILRRYVESDSRFPKNVVDACAQEYPFVDLEKRLIVLCWLCQQFLSSIALKTDIDSEGELKNEDHCRDCGKAGDLLCCDTCPAVYHLDCLVPPLTEPPEDRWLCPVCSSIHVEGVVDCFSEVLKFGYTVRNNYLGFDRHGRRYWFVTRRIFIEDSNSDEIWYYSTLSQFRQLLSLFDPVDFDRELCASIVEKSDEILEQMALTEKLTDQRKPESQISYFKKDSEQRSIITNNSLLIPNSENDNNVDSIFTVIKKIDQLLLKLKDGPKQSPAVGQQVHIDLDNLEIFSPANGIKNQFSSNNFIKKDDDDLSREFDSKIFCLYKMGSEKNYLKYKNVYSTKDLAKSPYQRAEERRLERYMSSRFHFDLGSKFQLPKGDTVDSWEKCTRVVRSGLLLLCNQYSVGLMHPVWPEKLVDKWKMDLNKATKPSELAHLLLTFEGHMRRIVFNEAWKNALGHTKFYRQTVEDREERKTRDKLKERSNKSLAERPMNNGGHFLNGEDDSNAVVWVKYSLLGGPPAHEIWKLKDEQYRINGEGSLGGWIWVKRHRTYTKPLKPYRYGFKSAIVWESAHGLTIDNLLIDVQNGYFLNDSANVDHVMHYQPDPNQPLCSDLPMDFNELTLEFEINRLQAVSQLGLSQHAESINVSLGLTQHSIYYKIGQGSKFLDKLLLARMNEETEKIEKSYENNGAFSIKYELLADFKCYSYECRRISGPSENGHKCYSYNCRASTSKDNGPAGTNFIHRLKFGSRFQSEKSSRIEFPVVALPKIHNFKSSKHSKSNILVLPKYYVKKLARNFLKSDQIEGFNMNCKGNPVVWPYPCIRPYFYTCWRYNVVNATSLHAVALLFRILYISIRWDEVQKTCPLDTKRTKQLQFCTETSEILKHKNLPPYGLSAKYFQRIVFVPIENKSKKVRQPIGIGSDDDLDEDYKPSNAQTAKVRDTRQQKMLQKISDKPTATVKWCDEDDLVIWEVRNYWLSELAKAKQKKIDEKRAIQLKTNANKGFVRLPPGVTIRSEGGHVSTVLSVSGTPNRKFTLKPASASKNGTSLAPAKTPQNSAPTIRATVQTPNGPKLLVFVKQPPGSEPGSRPRLVKIDPQSLSQAASNRFSPYPTNFKGKTANLKNNNVVDATKNWSMRQQISEDHRFCVSNAEIKRAIRSGLPLSDEEEDEQEENKEEKFDGKPSPSELGAYAHSEHVYGSKARVFQKQPPVDWVAERARIEAQSGAAKGRVPVPTKSRDRVPSKSRDPGVSKTPRRRQRGTSSSSGGQAAPARPRPRPIEPKPLFPGAPVPEIESATPSRPVRTPTPRSHQAQGFIARRFTSETDKKIRSEVSSLVAAMIQKINQDEKMVKKIQRQQDAKEIRRGYWKKYNMKRKLVMQIESHVSQSMTKWRKEIGKRRHIMQEIAVTEAKEDLEDGGLETYQDAKRMRYGSDLGKTRPPETLSSTKGAHSKATPGRGRTKAPRGRPSLKSTPFLAKPPPPSDSSDEEESRNSTIFQNHRTSLPQNQIKIKTTKSINSIEDFRDNPPDTSCVCNKPYDSTKFYVGCDLCSRYFHGKCVGVTAQISKRISSWYCPDCQRERQNAKQELYCICRTPYDESKFYISCDCCDLWFHGKCVGVEPDEGEDIPAFICQDCAQNQNGSIQPMIKPLEDRDFARLLRVLDTMETHKMSWPFKKPVDSRKHPGYMQVVQEPMDFSKLRTKLHERRHRVLAEFSNDVSLIFNNARKYFATESPEFQCATVLDRYFSDRLHEVKQEMIKDMAKNV